MHTDNVSTTAAEPRDRKTTKPIMEKRRRARINASLAELKSLLLEVIKREGARHSKMEKADILEMTVKHLRDMQRQSFTAASATDPTIINKRRLGFSECTQEVSRFLSNIDGCDVELRTRLLDHLANVVSGAESRSSPSPVTSLPVSSPSPFSPPGANQITLSNTQAQTHDCIQSSNTYTPDINNNIPSNSAPQTVQPTKVVSGLQVIPTKLQTGEIAFVLPGNFQGASNVSNYIIPVYTPNVSPFKPTVTMTTGGTTPGSYMTVVPSADSIQTCLLSPGNINITPVSSDSSPVSTSSLVSNASPMSVSSSSSDSLPQSSTSDSAMFSAASPLPHTGYNYKEIRYDRHHYVSTIENIRHQQTDNEQMWRPW